MNAPSSKVTAFNRLTVGFHLFKRCALKIKSFSWALMLLGIFIIGLDVACIMAVKTHSHRWNQQAIEQHRSVLNQFGNLDSHINQIAQQAPQFNILNTYFLSLEHTLGDLGIRLDSLATHQDVQNLAAQWQALPKNSAQSLEQAPSSTPLLPFTVLTVDVMNEQPFLVVEYDHRIVPLSRNDAIAEWHLIDVAYDTQEITWLNPQGKKIAMKFSEGDLDAR